MDVAITDVKVEGNLLSFQGTARLSGQNEKVQVFYMLDEEWTKRGWAKSIISGCNYGTLKWPMKTKFSPV